MISIRGDSHKREEMHQQLQVIQSTLDNLCSTLEMPVKELKNRIQSALDSANSIENSQSTLSGDIRELSIKINLIQSEIKENIRSSEEELRALHRQTQKIESDITVRLGAIETKLQRQDALLEQVPEKLEQQSACLEKMASTSMKGLKALKDLDAWKHVLPVGGNSDEGEWVSGISSALLALEENSKLRGNARRFTAQLIQNLRNLQELSKEIETCKAEEITENSVLLQRFDSILFRPQFDVAWIDIIEDECDSPCVRNELRALETALLNYRRRLRERLRKLHDFQLIPIVPHQTGFDAVRHEAVDIQTVPTNKQVKDNLIFSVERNGYQLRGEVLRRARVRRFLWDRSTSASPDEESEFPEQEPVLEEKVVLNVVEEDEKSEDEKRAEEEKNSQLMRM